MSAPKKRKGLTLEEKREVMLEIFFTSKEVFNLKDLEKLGSKVEKTVKDVVQSLVDDRMVEVDKIGSGNFYWAFPSKAYIAIKNNADALAAQLEANEVACTEAERRIAELSAGREDSATRAAQLKELAALKAEKEEVEKQLKQYAGSDPEALKELQAKARKAKAAADRWTDNVWTLKAHLVDKYGKMPGEVDALMGIPEEFDYVS